MLALVTALSFSFVDIAVAFADDEPIVEEPAIEQIEEQSDGLESDAIEEPIVDPEPQMPIIETPSRGLVGAISSNTGWYFAEDGIILANVREIAKQGPTSYNVLQGSCSNGGKYFYFAFMKKATEKVKIIKMKWSNGELKYSKSSGCINNYHGNGMTYVKDVNGKDKILITNAWSGHTNHISVLDVQTMKLESDIICSYWNDLSQCEMIYADGTPVENQQKTLAKLIKSRGKRGFSGIAYDQKSKRLAVTTCTQHDLIVFDLSVNSKGRIVLTPRKFIIEQKPSGVIQDIDCDENYIYVVWNSGGNKICVYDWNGNNVNNLLADNSYEMEGLFHTGEGNSAQFYATYHHSYKYNKVTYTKKKVKWKKVWNKKHTKKVWKYKTKKVKKITTYIYRNGYLRNLGNLTTA